MLIGVLIKKKKMLSICLVNASLNTVRFSFATDAHLGAGCPQDSPLPGGSVSTTLDVLITDLLWQRTF